MHETQLGWTSTDAGKHARGRRTRNTKPEVRLRSAVHRLGLRFRLHVQIARGCTPDFVLPRRAVAVFVEGCLWHGWPRHPPTFRGPNAGLWEQKLAANRARDVRAVAAARAAGWTVVRVRECEVRRDAAVPPPPWRLIRCTSHFADPGGSSTTLLGGETSCRQQSMVNLRGAV